MTSIISWLSIIGAIASITGALLAFYQANCASKHASEAESIKNEIIKKRKLVEISQIHTETRRILKIVSKIGPSSNPDLLKGIDHIKIVQEIEEYYRFLNEQKNHFSDSFINKADKLCTDLKPDIEILSEASSFKKIKASGVSIYYKISEFMPYIKDITDNKKETTNDEINKRKKYGNV